MADAVRTTCPYCGTGCGVLVERRAEGWTVSGDPDHPANFGRLCSKGSALAETLSLETRLLEPVVDGRPVDWAQAITATADRIKAVVDAHGPDAFAFYLSGQLLSEDYYAANKLAKGFIGTANVDTNSRLCMASSVAGHRRAFGSDTVPGCYEDLEEADLVVLVGSNLAWCHPVLFQRLKAARERRGTRVVVIDPRRTDSCAIADLHLRIKPDDDVALFNQLLVHCADSEALDQNFIASSTAGFEPALQAARDDLPGQIDAERARFFDWFVRTEKVVTIYSQGVNQSAAGTDKVNAIINVHLATGRIGRPGMGPFSVTGQPNAMGGREVGGLANQLAAHMGFDPASVDRVRRFWSAPRMATQEGLKAVDLFHAIEGGAVKAVWIMGTNPAVSLPDGALVRRALEKCPVVIVSDCVADTDTLRYAHIRLPALAWGEKSGMVTNSDRTMSRQRPFMDPAGSAKADWWAVAEVARVLGFEDGFNWPDVGTVYREYAALTAFENGGTRDLDLSASLAQDYDGFVPAQWGKRRMFGDGRFYTTDGKGRFVAVRPRDVRTALSPEFPLRLNTGRYRDHWHTMTRTGLSPRLSGHRPEPLLDIHPIDAARAGLVDGALARIVAADGAYLARAQVTDAQSPGEVFLPMHWNDRYAAQSVSGSLLTGHYDPVSGQPALKAGAVRVEAVAPLWHGLLIGQGLPEPSGASWWVRRRIELGEEVAMSGWGDDAVEAVVAWLDRVLDADRLEVRDPAQGMARFAWFRGGSLVAAFYSGRVAPVVASTWLAGLLGRPLSGIAERAAVMAGRPAGQQLERGPIVCACRGVSLAAIERAIDVAGITTVAGLGEALGAGTGCGSCVGEIETILSRQCEQAA